MSVLYPRSVLYCVSPTVTVRLPRSAGRTTDTADNAPKSLKSPFTGSSAASLLAILFVNHCNSRRHSPCPWLIPARLIATPAPRLLLHGEFPWMVSSQKLRLTLKLLLPPLPKPAPIHAPLNNAPSHPLPVHIGGGLAPSASRHICPVHLFPAEMIQRSA